MNRFRQSNEQVTDILWGNDPFLVMPKNEVSAVAYTTTNVPFECCLSKIQERYGLVVQDKNSDVSFWKCVASELFRPCAFEGPVLVRMENIQCRHIGYYFI